MCAHALRLHWRVTCIFVSALGQVLARKHETSTSLAKGFWSIGSQWKWLFPGTHFRHCCNYTGRLWQVFLVRYEKNHIPEMSWSRWFLLNITVILMSGTQSQQISCASPRGFDSSTCSHVSIPGDNCPWLSRVVQALRIVLLTSSFLGSPPVAIMREFQYLDP